MHRTYLSHDKRGVIMLGHYEPLFREFIQNYGYIAIFVMMVTNGFCSIPPSELVLATGGALSLGTSPMLWFPGVVIAAVSGNVVGNIVMYSIARYKGRDWCMMAIERWGKFVHIKIEQLYWMDKMFEKFGYGIIFFTRVAPVIRSAWSIPAGVSRMNFAVFTVFCAIGSTVYALMNGWLGGKISSGLSQIGEVESLIVDIYDKPILLVTVSLVLILSLVLGYRHYFKQKEESFYTELQLKGGATNG